MTLRPRITIHWFRRDLRVEDNHSLYRALSDKGDVLPLFIFDTDILDRLEDRADRRVDLIHRTLTLLKTTCEEHGSSLLVLHGRPIDVWRMITEEYDVQAVYTAHDHEPYAMQRDAAVQALLDGKGIPFTSVKDISIFERDEVLKDDGTPYTVYTPYMRKWRSLFHPELAEPFLSEDLLHRLWRTAPLPMPSLSDLGFSITDLSLPPETVTDVLLQQYANTRDIPSVNGTSRMSVHLRFGTVSVRYLVRRALRESEKYLNELIWREFYMMIVYHFPHVVESSFRPAYDHVPWLNDEQQFQAWSAGLTGYPLVDAGMRELNSTGHMHNRVRMVVASFLTKHLLIDWRWGEAYFASKLLDFELSSNNGGWQWAAGSGCDAAPYFRVFSPTAQQERFDPALKYVKKWVPEHGTANYMQPMVVHEMARKRAIETYKLALARS